MKLYALQSWPEHSQGPSEQKPIKHFGISSRGHSQGLPKIFRALIHRTHRAVIFAIAQLSSIHKALTVVLFIGSPGSRLSMDEIVSKACKEVHMYLTHKLVRQNTF